MYVFKKSGKIFTTLVDRQDIYYLMQNLTRNRMVFSVFPSTVPKVCTGQLTIPFAQPVYVVTRKLAGVSVCFKKKSGKIFTALLNRPEIHYSMLNFMRNPMVFSFFPSTV